MMGEEELGLGEKGDQTEFFLKLKFLSTNLIITYHKKEEGLEFFKFSKHLGGMFLKK